MFIYIFTTSVSAEDDKTSNDFLVCEDIKGVHSDSADSLSTVQTEEDLNWNAGDIFIKTYENTVHIEIPVLGEEASWDLEMYPSKMGMDSQNRMIGIEKELHDKYRILRFIAEKDTSYLYLYKPNLHLLGKTVIHLGIADNTTDEVYLTQFEAELFDYDTMYSKISNGTYSDTELTDIELNYFSMQALEELEHSFSDAENLSASGEGSASVDDGNSNKIWKTIQENKLDKFIGRILHFYTGFDIFILKSFNQSFHGGTNL